MTLGLPRPFWKLGLPTGFLLLGLGAVLRTGLCNCLEMFCAEHPSEARGCASSLRRTECDAEFFPRRLRAGCGRDGAAASHFCGNLSQLGTLSSGTVFGFSIAGGDALPERLSSLLGVLHLFTLLSISVVILCNTTTFLFPGVVLSRNSDFYYVFFFFHHYGMHRRNRTHA